MKSFLLIDDHVIIRSGIKTLISEIFSLCTIHEACNGETATEKLKENQYDLIMLDIQMPKSDSLGLMEYIHISYPGSRVLIFSMSAESIYAQRFLKAGAKGFISKEAPIEEIKKAITLIINDRKYISESLANTFTASMSETPQNLFNALSRREFEIASLLLAGKTVSEISRSLNLRVSTVGTHKGRVFDKLSISHILELKELATSYNM